MGSETPLDLGSDEDRSRCACDATYGKCINCVRNENEYDEDPGDCWNCGGEGYIADCFDGFCEEAEYGCEDCTRPCPECARPKPNSDEMRRVLAEALEQANGPTPAILSDGSPSTKDEGA